MAGQMGGARPGAGRPKGTKDGEGKTASRIKAERALVDQARRELGRLAVDARRAGYATVLQAMTNVNLPMGLRLRAADIALRATMPEQPAVPQMSLQVNVERETANVGDLVRARLKAIHDRKAAASADDGFPGTTTPDWLPEPPTANSAPGTAPLALPPGQPQAEPAGRWRVAPLVIDGTVLEPRPLPEPVLLPDGTPVRRPPGRRPLPPAVDISEVPLPLPYGVPRTSVRRVPEREFVKEGRQR